MLSVLEGAKDRKRTIIVTVALAIVFVSAIASAATTYTRFESLSNCDGDGGWLVSSESNGTTTLTILCDGGTLVQP